MMKECLRCHLVKTVDDFYKSKTCRNGVYSYCKECSRVIAAEYRAAHPELKEQRRKYMQTYNKRNK